MPPPPFEDDPALYILTSLTAGSSHIVTATSRLETILRANRIPFKALDLATDVKAGRLWARRAGKDAAGRARKLPGLMQEGWVIGDLVEVDEWNEYGELKQHVKIHYDEYTIPSINNKHPEPKLKRPVKKTTGSTKVATAISGVAAAAKGEDAVKADATSETDKNPMRSLAVEAAAKAKELKLKSLREKVHGAGKADIKAGEDEGEKTEAGEKTKDKQVNTKNDSASTKETTDTEQAKAAASTDNETPKSEDSTKEPHDDGKSSSSEEDKKDDNKDVTKDAKGTALKSPLAADAAAAAAAIPASSVASTKVPEAMTDDDRGSTDKANRPQSCIKTNTAQKTVITSAGLQSPTSSTWKEMGQHRLEVSMQSPTSGQWKKTALAPAQGEPDENSEDSEDSEDSDDSEDSEEDEEEGKKDRLSVSGTNKPSAAEVKVKAKEGNDQVDNKDSDEKEEEGEKKTTAAVPMSAPEKKETTKTNTKDKDKDKSEEEEEIDEDESDEEQESSVKK